MINKPKGRQVINQMITTDFNNQISLPEPTSKDITNQPSLSNLKVDIGLNAVLPAIISPASHGTNQSKVGY
jgi:hypothetical protein